MCPEVINQQEIFTFKTWTEGINLTSFNDGYFICFFYMRGVSLAKGEGE